jgi:hypothetical protein
MPTRADVITPAVGCVVGGVASTVTVITVGSIAGLSVAGSAAAVGVAGIVVGIALGTQITLRHLRAFADDWRLIIGSALVLIALVGILSVPVFSPDGGAAPFWIGMAGLYPALIGWVALLAAGQTDEASAAVDTTDELVSLPEETIYPGVVRGGTTWKRIRRYLPVLGGLEVVIVLAYAWLQREPTVLVFLLIGLPLLFQLSPAPTRVTEDGLVFEQRFRGYSVGTKLVEWKNFEGYRVEDDTLVIVYESRWRDLVYDRAKIDDLDRTTAVLDRYLPELSDEKR